MPTEVTQLLADLRGGKPLAADELFPIVLDELRGQAAKLLRGERQGHTRQTTALVHEAYLRLAKQTDSTWQDRAHFLAIAAQAMRRVLVDHARQRRRAKREGGRDRIPLDSALLVMYEEPTGVDGEALDRALKDLARIRTRAAQVVGMRFFSGMTIEEIGCVLNSSVSTIEREWRYARAWLKDALTQTPREPSEKAGHEEDDRTTGG